VAGTLSPILDGIVALLEGTAGTAPVVIPAGRFTLADTLSDFARPFVADGDPRPFSLGYPRLVDSGMIRGDATSGTYARRAHELDLVVLYSDMRRDQLVPVQRLLDDEALITGVLEYELSVATVAGWEGLTVTSCAVEDLVIPPVDGAPEGRSPFKVLHFVLLIHHREEITP
jgi:hypothetical protein